MAALDQPTARPTRGRARRSDPLARSTSARPTPCARSGPMAARSRGASSASVRWTRDADPNAVARQSSSWYASRLAAAGRDPCRCPSGGGRTRVLPGRSDKRSDRLHAPSRRLVSAHEPAPRPRPRHPLEPPPRRCSQPRSSRVPRRARPPLRPTTAAGRVSRSRGVHGERAALPPPAFTPTPAVARPSPARHPRRGDRRGARPHRSRAARRAPCGARQWCRATRGIRHGKAVMPRRAAAEGRRAPGRAAAGDRRRHPAHEPHRDDRSAGRHARGQLGLAALRLDSQPHAQLAPGAQSRLGPTTTAPARPALLARARVSARRRQRVVLAFSTARSSSSRARRRTS